jgi:hypothetical protein
MAVALASLALVSAAVLAVKFAVSEGFVSLGRVGSGIKVTRIPARNILIGASHTHSAPDVYAFPNPKGGHTGDLAYIQEAINKKKTQADLDAERETVSKYAPTESEFEHANGGGG